MKKLDLQSELKLKKLEFQTRRHFLKKCSTGLGSVAMAVLGGCNLTDPIGLSFSGYEKSDTGSPHFFPKAKRVIYLHMAGSPSQFELFEYKPELDKLHDQQCPESFLEGKKFAFISGVPKMLGHQYSFSQHGQSGAWVSNRMPEFSKVVDKVCFLRAMHTDEFNHAPAQLLLYSGSPRLGRPSMGSWITYGLGSLNNNLPGYIVLVSGGATPSAGKSLWGSGFLPSIYQGVQCRTEGDPVLYTSNPGRMNRELRGKSIDAINEINRLQYEEYRDPETLTRIAQYEMAFKMQVTVPKLMDISKEPDYIHELYGTSPGTTSFANNCLLARRLAEQDVRFIQLFHWGWDSHGASRSEALNGGFMERCAETDKPIKALLLDLEQRGMLEETLVVWGGEFGRTPMLENRNGLDNPFTGRDHHTEAFTMWMAGGGIKPGFSYGETDEIGYFGIKDRVHVHDLQATILHALGLRHEDLTYYFQGRDYRLTDQFGSPVLNLFA